MAHLQPDMTADDRWTSVATRDRAADGRFVYAVVTTGVYCRPSCPSRRPKPENVRFFATNPEAEKAGFRPCLRCKPDAASTDARAHALVVEACRLIDAAEEAPGLEELAAQLGVSPFHFHRQFKAITGMTPKAYAAGRRAERMRAALGENETVTASIYEAGYGSASRFYEKANAVLGMSPTQFRDSGKAVKIHFALGASSLGAVLVAQTDKGVCAILLGDDPEALVRDLQDRFPKATLVGGDSAFETTVARVVGLIEQPGRTVDLPLDLKGTVFQQKVWRALRAIPAGKTASYQDIARAIGAPTSMRAVAQACGANKVAVAVPCHRVVRQDGDLSGYRWGVDRKRELLRREGSR